MVINMKEVKTTKAQGAIGPYSQAIVSNGFVFFSGQIPLKDGILIDDYSLAVDVIMNNIKAILKEANTSIDKLVKTTIFIKDISKFSIVNEAYEKHLTKPFAARSVVEVSNLPKNAILEIEGVAEV